MGLKMAEDKEEQKSQSFGSYNRNVIADTSFMKMRLNTAPLIDSIRKGLSAIDSRIVFGKDGEAYEEWKKLGEPLANEEGVMHICNMVEEIINQHMAQGNLKEDHYWDFIARKREDFTVIIVINRYNWGIEDHNLNHIINRVMDMMELFLTRPIDNKERDSYKESFISKELVSSMGKGPGALQTFGAGFGKK